MRSKDNMKGSRRETLKFRHSFTTVEEDTSGSYDAVELTLYLSAADRQVVAEALSKDPRFAAVVSVLTTEYKTSKL